MIAIGKLFLTVSLRRLLASFFLNITSEKTMDCGLSAEPTPTAAHGGFGQSLEPSRPYTVMICSDFLKLNFTTGNQWVTSHRRILIELWLWVLLWIITLLQNKSSTGVPCLVCKLQSGLTCDGCSETNLCTFSNVYFLLNFLLKKLFLKNNIYSISSK